MDDETEIELNSFARDSTKCIACQMSRNGESADKREIDKRNGEEQKRVDLISW